MKSLYTLLLLPLLIPTPMLAQKGLPDDPGEFQTRREALMARLNDGIFLTHSRWALKPWPDPGQRQNPTFYYLTGLERQVGGVLVLDAPKGETILFVPARIGSLQAWGALVTPGQEGARALALTDVRTSEQLVPYIDARVAEDATLKLYVEGRTRGFPPPPGLDPFAGTGAVFQRTIATKWPDVEVVAARNDIMVLRATKSPSEVDAIRRAAHAASEGFLAGLRGVRPGRMQRDVEGDIVAACLANDAQSLSWWPWAQTGPNAIFPAIFEAFADYRHLNRRMEAGELARIDIGCEVDHYQSDVGRTAPVSGQWTDAQRETWDLFVDSYRASMGVIRDGVRVDSVLAAFQREVRARAGDLNTQLARRAAEILLDRQQIPSWQIHGVGLEAAEGFGRVLREGMVVAYEPMFTVDEFGFYLEDLLLITTDGYELLTPGLPYTAVEIERTMAKR